MNTENLFWPLVLSLISWACLAIAYYAPWEVTMALGLLALGIVALVAYGFVKLPPLLDKWEIEDLERERKLRHATINEMVREYQRRNP